MSIQIKTLNKNPHFTLWESTLVPNPLEIWFKNSSSPSEDLPEILAKNHLHFMWAEIKATLAEDRNAKELHRTLLPSLAAYSCTWSNPLWSLPFCYGCAHFEKQYNTPMADFFWVIYIVIIRGCTSESSISFLGFIGAFHVTHRNQTVNCSGKLFCDPSSPLLISSRTLRSAHKEDKHQHKKLQVWTQQGTCHREFLSLVEQMWDREGKRSLS